MEQIKKPFEGIRVCDFSWFAAAPVATKTLADFGAEVIKMESSVRPDGIRIASPLSPGKEDSLNVSGWFNNQNSSKLCLGLNLAHPQAKKVYDKLILASDVVVENFSPRMKDNLGLNYEEYAKLKPDLIWVDQPMQGLKGPHRNRAGFGALITPLGGLSATTGFANRPPIGTGTNYTDYVINPGQLSIAIIAALRRRKQTGEGRHIVMAQVASSTSILETTILDYTVNGRIPERTGNRIPNAAPHGCFRCRGEDRECTILTPLGPAPARKNERWCAIAVFTDEQWRALCDVVGNPPWTADPKFSSLVARKENEDELEGLLGEWTSQRSAEEVMLSMQKAGVPAGVVQDAEDLLVGDPHLKARDYYVYLDHPETGLSAYDSFACKLSATPCKPSRPAPRIGEHTEQVCKEILGMDDEEYVELLVEEVLEIG
ncbi:MAG: CoA transferase [Proteobacteria bacterium]|nr:CoA transferase [Pseudomonadota bacterium]